MENTISNSYDGVDTRIGDGWDVTGLEIHINDNNITGSTRYGVNNTVLGILDAECNWWNSADGPGPVGSGHGDNVSTNVDFSPWLISPAPDGICAATKKGCQDAVEQQEKDFNNQQQADKKSFDNQQKQDKKNFDATHPTAAQKKAFDDQQKAQKTNFDNQQKAAKASFDQQYKANEMRCSQLSK
jgi:hypothetical protein